ncbi:MAG: MFS transporter, partial [Opitutales bacterium]|nr:MFS transporter [Opitutales bacterium]
ADRFATKFGAENVIKVSGILIASGLSLAVVFPKISTSSVGFALVGFGVSSIVPLCYSLAGKCRTMATGAALTGVSSIGFFGFLMGPPLIGYISEHSSLRWSFTLILFVGFSATFLSPILKRLNKTDSSELDAVAGESSDTNS